MHYGSLEEWMKQTKIPIKKWYSKENATKRERLKKLKELTNFNYEKSSAIDIPANITKDARISFLLNIINKSINPGQEFSFRLLPKEGNKAKLRTEGGNLASNMRWLMAQKVDLKKYILEIIPHFKNSYSGILISNENGIFGDIIKGMHWQLTRGCHNKCSPNHFSFDFKRTLITLPNKNPKIPKIIKKVINKLKNIDKKKRLQIKKELKANFCHQGYLQGYFEFIVLKNGEIIFTDYNRAILNLLKHYKFEIPNLKTKIKGVCASKGEYYGRARIMKNDTIKNFKDGDILISKNLTIKHINLIKKAGAIVSEQGNTLSHPSLIIRELHKPYIINVNKATKKIKDSDLILVDATNSSISR